ncbi:MAG: dihydroorotate dehydrogenase electron transfer subunit [Geodermatophilaceae bacterium]|nr:dihydroorotate dehydrogenase electron transfer subunit [Geodermatophilaceae bacterium]MDQ3456357.1 dihydroorotate dehydrogenase electron transfer subunit [Actinomycetota bacterium]
MTVPSQVRARLVGSEPVGAYHLLTLDAPAVAAGAGPGQFVAVAVGGPGSAMLLRRAFALYTADPATGLVQVVVAEHRPGTAWLVHSPVGTELDLVGPLGRPFPLPAAAGTAVLVAGGYGSAPMFDLARRLRERGSAVHLVLGAATGERLFGADEAPHVADTVTVTTDDGSTGRRGLVTDGLTALVEDTAADVLYACGPMAMLRAVGEIAAAYAVPCHVAVEEAMACGIGVCMTCVLPVIGADGRSRMVRSCTEGPVFEASRVRWKDVGTLPADVVGADAMGGHR